MDEKTNQMDEPIEQVREEVVEQPPEEKTEPQPQYTVVGLFEQLEGMKQAIAGLQQSFDDKIAEDQYKNGLFDSMHRELVRYQNGALDKVVDTVALDIIQLVDTTSGHVRVYEQKEPNEENYKRLLRVVKGVVEDLQDILYRQNIEPYTVDGDAVDVRRQKIIQTVPTDDSTKDNLIAMRAAEGYEKGDKVLRPERIKIYKYTPAESTEQN